MTLPFIRSPGHPTLVFKRLRAYSTLLLVDLTTTQYGLGYYEPQHTTGFKRRQFLGGLHQNLVWPSCRRSFRQQFLVLRMSQHPPIITENWSQFKSKLRFLNIFFLKPGLTKKFHFMKSFQFSLDGAVCFMPENFKTILKKIGAATSKSGLAMFFNIFLQNFWLNHFLSKNSSELSSQNWRFRA